jgi:hypothetical protein
MSKGRIVATGVCFLCGGTFRFDIDKVPSVPIDPANGLPPDLGGDAERAERQPICEPCITFVNARRAAFSRKLWPIPEGAYL